MMNTSESSFKYDVAFSFLSRDLKYAQKLAQDLEPALSTFVYTREKEELLGRDGMDQFGSVFRHDARLTVILYREGWGKTPWTAYEETRIKDRALDSRMTSFLLVTLEDAELPRWVPETHLYASTSSDTHLELLTVIKLRAREQGAVLRKENAVEYAIRLKRERDAAGAREERARSFAAVGEVQQEVKRLFQHLIDAVEALKISDPTIDVEAGATELECAVAGPLFSISLTWHQQTSNTLRDAWLRVNEWRGRVKLPSAETHSAGPGWYQALHYVPAISEEDEWVWQHNPSMDDNRRHESLVIFDFGEPESFRTHEFGEHLLRRLFGEAFPEQAE